MTVAVTCLTLVTMVTLAALAGCARSTEIADVQSEFRITAVGRVDTYTEARRVRAQIDRRIEKVHVQEGDWVETDQILVSLACPNELAMLDLARSDVELAEKRLAQARAKPRPSRVKSLGSLVLEQEALVEVARKDYERLDVLAGRNLASVQEKETQQFKLAAAKARLEFLQADFVEQRLGATREEIEVARASVGVANSAVRRHLASHADCEIRAPIGGHILRIEARPGEQSWGEQALVVLGDFTRIKIRVEIDERDAAAIRPGDRAAVWVNGESKRAEGKVVSVARVAGRRLAQTFDPADRFDRETVEADLVLVGSQDMIPGVLDLRVVVGFF